MRNDDVPDDFLRKFDGELTEEAETVLVAVGGGLEWELMTEWLRSPELAGEGIKRWRRNVEDPELQKKAERIVLQEIVRLAGDFPVNGPMRLAIVGWCFKRLDGGKVGSPGLNKIEEAYWLVTIKKIVEENRGSRAKSIITAIMKELKCSERSAKSWKKKAEKLLANQAKPGLA